MGGMIRLFRRVVGISVLFAALGVIASACAAGAEGAEGAEAEHIHPDFDITHPELEEQLAGAATELHPAFGERFAPRILERPEYFLELLRQSFAEPEELLWLVDKEHSLSADYAPEDLVSLNRYSDRLVLNRDDLSLRALILPDLFAMVEAARLDGILLDLSSTFRSYSYQEGLFQRHVDELGEEEASRVSARPGTSQHQLGTTVDFGSVTPAFADTEAGKWLADNASEYGFSLSYPDGYEELTGYSYEPWHFRFISRVGTELEGAFFGGIQQQFLEFYAAEAAWFEERLRAGRTP
jgi:D-alanyl-D-alanine carboxypeptidase